MKNPKKDDTSSSDQVRISKDFDIVNLEEALQIVEKVKRIDKNELKSCLKQGEMQLKFETEMRKMAYLKKNVFILNRNSYQIFGDYS